MAALVYSAAFGTASTFAGISLFGAQDLFSFSASASYPFRIRRYMLSTTGQTSPANVIVSIKRMPPVFTIGSGGTTPGVPEVAQLTGRAAAATVHANDTSRASTTGTAQFLFVGTMQDLNNMDEVRVPELYELVPGGYGLVIGSEVALAATTSVYGTVWFSEMD